MPKITRQDVMQKYTVRVYDKDQADLLNRAMEKFMPMIGNKTDTIRRMSTRSLKIISIKRRSYRLLSWKSLTNNNEIGHGY